MAVYTVHAPSDVALRDDPDAFVFLRDGFHFWAMVFGPFWPIWHGLWLVLLGYLAVSIAIGTGLWLTGAGSGTRLLVLFVFAVLMGLEAASLRRWSYSRRKWRQIDFVVADDEEAAERRFFDRWTEAGGMPPAATWQVPPPLPREPRAASPGIIGLFPEPGGSR